MAALRGILEIDTGKSISRLARQRLESSLNTWHTKVTTILNKDGTCRVCIMRDGIYLLDYEVEAPEQ